jgi:hypothetical protein
MSRIFGDGPRNKTNNPDFFLPVLFPLFYVPNFCSFFLITFFRMETFLDIFSEFPDKDMASVARGTVRVKLTL